MSIIYEKEILTAEIIFQKDYNNKLSSSTLFNLKENNLSIINNVIEKYNMKNKELNTISRNYIYSFYTEFNIEKIIIPKMFNNVDIYKINKIEDNEYVEIKYDIIYNSNNDIEILLDEENIKEISREIISKKEMWPRIDNLVFIKY